MLLGTAAALIVSISGCNGSPKESDSGKSSTGSQSKAESKDTASHSSSTSEAIGFKEIVVPMPEKTEMKYPVEEGGTVSMWVGLPSISSKYYQTLAEDITVKKMEEDTGITVKFVHPAQGQASENFNLLALSDSLPDMIVDGNSYYSGGSAAAVNDGIFLDLTELIPQYAPDYNYFLENNDLFWRLATNDDGSIYNLYNYKDVTAPYHTRPQFRKDWLDEWSMEIPKTLDEYEQYFKKVQETYPDVSPFTLTPSGLEVQILGAFGIATVDNGTRFYVKDGQVHHTFNEPELKNYLTLMHDWYQKKYINKDFSTVKAEDEFTTGRTGFLIGNSDRVYTLAKELEFDPVSGPYPRIKADDPYHGDIFYFPQNGTPASISAKSKNKELALKFLNYGFTKQGSAVINFGDPDTSWKWSTEKNAQYKTTIPEYTDYALHNTKYPMSDIEYTIRLHTSWCKYRYGDDVSMIRNVADPECWNYRAKWGDDETCDNSYALPTLNFSPDTAKEVGELKTDINTYAEEMCLKFITGASPLSEYDTFSKQVQSLGMPRLLEIYQQGYDTLLAKKH